MFDSEINTVDRIAPNINLIDCETVRLQPACNCSSVHIRRANTGTELLPSSPMLIAWSNREAFLSSTTLKISLPPG